MCVCEGACMYMCMFIVHVYVCEREILVWCPFSTTQLPDKHGITALLAAIYEDHEECVRVLVSSVSHCSTC